VLVQIAEQTAAAFSMSESSVSYLVMISLNICCKLIWYVSVVDDYYIMLLVMLFSNTQHSTKIWCRYSNMLLLKYRKTYHQVCCCLWLSDDVLLQKLKRTEKFPTTAIHVISPTATLEHSISLLHFITEIWPQISQFLWNFVFCQQIQNCTLHKVSFITKRNKQQCR